MRKTALLLGAALLGAVAVLLLPDWLGRSFSTFEPGAEGLASGGWLGALGIAWLGGLLTSLTPCVYPLIPITVAAFGAKEARGRAHALALSSTYVLGIASMFSVLGFAAASSGKVFGAFLANPWVGGGLGLFFVLMAASMWGAFELRLPSGLAGRLSRVGGIGFGGAFAMGLVAGIIAAPCTGPVLSSLLTFVATSGSPTFGFVLLFAYALGIGVPFLLLGGFSVSLPKSGPWLEGVKSFFGVALATLAFFYLRDAFPALRGALAGWEVPLLLGPTLVAAGILFGGIHRSFHGTGALERAAKGAGLFLLVLGLILRMGLPGAGGGGVTWQSDLEVALEQARSEGKPVMIDFYADWCAACKELDRYTFSDGAVAAEAAHFVNVKIDGTHESPAIDAIYDRFDVQGLPTVVFLDESGETLESPRVTGFLEAGRFLELMKEVRAKTLPSAADGGG